ncbi:MAG: hypothetical protein Q9221_000720 [Calogaya cf. arnoldii]
MDPQVADALGEHRGAQAQILYNTELAILSDLSAGSIDLYDVLIEVAEEIAHEREGDSDTDDWLLGILDEAVNDTPAKEHSEEQEQPMYTSQYGEATLWDDEKLSSNEKAVTYFYELKKHTNTASSMDAGADPRTWSISNVQQSDLIWFAIVSM